MNFEFNFGVTLIECVGQKGPKQKQLLSHKGFSYKCFGERDAILNNRMWSAMLGMLQHVFWIVLISISCS